MLKKTFFVFLVLMSLTACDFFTPASQTRVKTLLKTLLQGKTMGTTYNIGVVHFKNQKVDGDALKVTIDDLLENINQQVSTYIPSSQISQFNKREQTDWFKVDKDFFTTVESAQLVSEETQGLFDISVSPIINLWGFGAEKNDQPPNEDQIKKALTNVGYKQLQLDPELSSLKKLKPSLSIDLSAIAKGFAVDKISQLLMNKGFSDHIVEIGGELRVSGHNQNDKAWRIAIEQPDVAANTVSRSVAMTNLAVATSGDYRNYFVENGVRRSHIIDPTTGYPVTHNLASVTVLHESAMMADAYATALLVMGDAKGKAFAKEHQLDVLMIVREKNQFTFWSSSDIFK